MKVGYSQNSNKITEKSHLVNITFCFCLCLSFYTTWQLVVLCHISKLTFTNIWLGFNIPLHMDHDVSSLHSFPVQSEVENQSFPRIWWKLQQASPLSWFIDNSLHFNASSFKEKLLWPLVHIKIGWDFFFYICEDSHSFRKKSCILNWDESPIWQLLWVGDTAQAKRKIFSQILLKCSI